MSEDSRGPERARYLLRLAYVGTRYGGWQRQPNALTVQQVVEEALARVLDQPARDFAIVGAARTDAGVHADGQAAHVALAREAELAALVGGTNHFLPRDVRVLDAAPVPAAFDARKSAVAKEYRYRVFRGRVPAPALAPFVAAVAQPVDLARVADALALLPGRHDFSAFALSGGSHRDPVRTIYAAAAREEGAVVELSFVGSGFLRGMVRSLVGTLLEIGAGRRSRADFARLLAGGERAESGPTAPASGLTLVRVDYAPRAGH